MKWVILAIMAATVWCDEVLRYQDSSKCKAEEYYDVSSLSCARCASNSSLVPSMDGFSCVCNSHSRLRTAGATASCEPCQPDQVLSSDRASCVPRRCVRKEDGRSSCQVCTGSQISVTVNADGSPLKEVKCVSCRAGYRPSTDRTSCAPCSIISTNNINSCSCRKTEDLIRGACVPKTFVQMRDQYKPKLRSVWNHGLFNELVKLEYLCLNGNGTACGALANLCVLSFYDADQDGPCRLWLKSSLPPGLPVLMYGENEAYSVLNQKTVPTTYRFSDNEQNSELRLAMAMYVRGGGSVQFSLAASEWGSLCPRSKSVQQTTFRLGYNYRHKCKVTVKEILAQERAAVVAPYLLYSNTTNASERITPVAVAIKIEGSDYMKTSDLKNLRLFHRYFLLDAGPGTVTNQSDSKSLVAWYLHSATLKIKIEHRSSEQTNRIYTPLLMLEYASIKFTDLASSDHVTLSFQLLHEMGGNTFIHAMETSVGVLAAAAVLYSMLQTWGMSKRTACSTTRAALHFLLFSCGNLSNALYVVSLGASLHSLVMFKWQHVVTTLPPTHKEHWYLEAFIISAFTLKLMETAWINWKQSGVDVFLLDWLTPHLSTALVTYETERDSGWRRLLVAQHWCRLQTRRRVSPVAYVIITLFILEVVKSSSIPIEESISYQHAGSAAVLILVYCVLAALRWCRDKYRTPAHLTDVCAAVNVSLLVFEEDLYAHYVHGRTVETTDVEGGERVSLQERGLLPELPHQAFSISCDTNFRLIYMKLSERFVSPDFRTAVKNYTSSRTQLTNKSDSLDTLEDLGSRMLRDPRKHSHALLTKFLASFFDQALEGCTWVVRERSRLSQLLGVELSGGVGDAGAQSGVSVLMYTTPETHSYLAVVWSGAECTLATFDVFLFGLVQWLSHSHLLAGFVVICTYKVMQLLRHEAGVRNFIRKSNMDPTFIH